MNQQQRLTPEEQAAQNQRTHMAMEAAQGDRKKAATALGITVVMLKNRLNNSPELKVRWMRSHDQGHNAAPTDTEIMATGPMQVPALLKPEVQVMRSDKELAQMVKREDAELLNAELAKLLDKMGVSADEQSIAKSLQEFHGKQYLKMANITGGSVALAAIKLSKLMNHQIEDYYQQSEDGNFKGDFGHLRQVQLAKAIQSTVAELRQLNSDVSKGMLIQAQIDMKKQEAKTGSKKAKFGSRPLGQATTQVLVQPGAQVHLNAPKEEKE